ncbi:Phosphonate C-P lyase system protein PhnG [Nitratireductor basaltis]|uniref:Phosphonate C-P lyase system protein PhnG n=2 Tax=Nitratireductor basaltis TaxID=472175 RepID=A0A084UEK4_9HYPH|nr:phosphonate C-P lyase system protein PhnG [Nitratireductor basaltis]KFB11390.1 Phosphonate C-P lyase system protein PhnG [Nitratireductor basaltis]
MTAALSRQEAMGILARAPGKRLGELFSQHELPSEAQDLRGPETGLVALRGRIGGGGSPFNFGDATVTRASVKLPTGEIGHAYALGRDQEKVRLSALLDALRQRSEHASRIDTQILFPLRHEQEAEDRLQREETAATRVDFFTMTRGED